MIKIKQLKKNNEDFYPVVPIESVVFPDGSTLNDKNLVVEEDLQDFYNKSEADSTFVATPDHNADVARLEGAIGELSDRIDNIRPGGIESETDPVFSASPAAGITNSDIQNWNSKSSTSGTVTGVRVNGVNATVTNGLAEVNIPVDNVDESTIAGYGFTKNQGTITGITMNGLSKGVSGNIDLGTVITEHQNISGKENTSNKVTSISSNSTNTQYPSAKAVYDKIGDLSQLSTSAKGNLVSAINEAATSSSFSGDYNDLTHKPTIPTQLSQLSEDATHQTVTAAEKQAWTNASGFSGSYDDLTNKPTIPTEQTVAGWGFAKTSSITESDPTVPSYVKSISQNDIANWNSKTSNTGTLTGVTFNGNAVPVANGVAQITAATGTGGDENVIESISVNNVQQAISSKNVNITVPTNLADLSADSTHQTVTSVEKAAWDAKSSFSGNYSDLQGKPSTVNYTQQSLTSEQQAQARTNIGAGTSNFGGTYNELTGKPSIPTALADLSDDSTHRLVTDAEKTAWGAKYDKPAGGIPSTDLASNILSGYATQASLDAVTAKIPAEASSSNQLADKAFVNSSIASSTGNLITDNGDSWSSLSDLQNYSGTVNTNDYAFVSTTDGLGNTVYSRYKYSNGSWVKEYDLNNSSFTQAQWDTINSGATAAKVSAHDTHVANTDIHVTAADKLAWNAKSNFSGSYNDLTNKPTLSTVATSGSYNDLSNKPTLSTVASTGSYADLTNKPTIPAAQVNSDWNASSGVAQILNKPTIPDVSGFANKVVIGGTNYTASGGAITLPNYPTLSSLGAMPADAHIPTDPVQSDWNINDPTSLAFIKNKPNLTTYFEPGTGSGSLRRKEQSNSAIGVNSISLGTYTNSDGLNSVAEGNMTRASGTSSHAEGELTTAGGYASHAEGSGTYADSYAHAEGENTRANAYNSHAEGLNSIASSFAAHAEGISAATGYVAHSEGGDSYDSYVNIVEGSIVKTSITGGYTRVEFGADYMMPDPIGVIINDVVYEVYDYGSVATNVYYIVVYGNPDTTYCDHFIFIHSLASGDYSHSENWGLAKGNRSHAEGTLTTAVGDSSHSEGNTTIASGWSSHAEGISSFTNGVASHAENSAAAIGDASHAEGGSWYMYSAEVTALSAGNPSNGLCTLTYTLAPYNSVPTDAKAVAINERIYYINNKYNNQLVLETSSKPDITNCRVLFFYNSVAKGHQSHSEGISVAYGDLSHAEGQGTISGSNASHSEGVYTRSWGLGAHTEGIDTYAYYQGAHAEGINTSAGGYGAHTEGIQTYTYAQSAHAEGSYTRADGFASHAEGSATEAINTAEHAQGQYNVSHSPSGNSYSFGYGEATLHSIGIGTSNNDRMNAVEVMDNGDVYIKGIGSYDGTNPSQASTLQSVINNASSSGTDPNAMHLTGAETAAGVKTFSDGIVVPDADHITFGNVSVQGSGYTKYTATGTVTGNGSSISFDIDNPKAFIVYCTGNSNPLFDNRDGVISAISDSTGIRGIYSNIDRITYSNNEFTATYSNHTLEISIDPGADAIIDSNLTWNIIYFVGNNNLTFRTATYTCTTNSVTSTTYSGLNAQPVVYYIQPENRLNGSTQYRRFVSALGEFNTNYSIIAKTIYNYDLYDTSNNLTVSYNNGLTINTGGANSGGYFHNETGNSGSVTFKLYYLTEDDLGSQSAGSNSTLQDELDAKYEKPSSGIPASDLASDVRTALNNANNAIQTETDPVFAASPAYSITSQHITSWNGKQDALVSGTTLKTINNQSLLGSGNISITGGTGGTGADGADGQSTYKSTVFVRTNNTPNAPTTGSYNSPAPGDLAGTNAAGQSVYWSDGIPAGKETLWASTRKFTNDGVGQDASWSTPRAMTDTETYNVEFAPLLANDAKPSAPTYGTNGTLANRGTGNNRNDGLYNSFTTARNNNIVWFDPDLDANITGIDFTQMVWRAEQPVVNGVGGNWTILRIKGEDGARGDDGDPAIYLDLTNEHDSFLYDTNGSRLTPAISTTAILYEAGEPISGVTYGIDTNNLSGCTQGDVTLSSNNGSTPGVVTVSGASNSGYVTITATYNGITYSTKFTFTRVVGYAKFDLEVTPNAITYNTTTQQASQSTINVEIYCTQQGSSGITRNKLTSLDSRYTLKVDGNSVANNLYSSGYSFNVDPTRSSHVITLVEGNILWDTETVPIGKVADGSSGSGPGGQGQPGADGYSSIIVKLYKDYVRTSNDPELPAVTWPSGSNTTTYTFATDTLSAAPTGWSRTRPSSPLGIVYVIAATFSGNTATDTANINEWSDPAPDSTFGLYCDTVELFYRTSSATATPNKPTTTVTYNFNTGAISPSSPNGWTRTKPVHNGYPLWVTQATVISSAASVSIAGSKWSNPQKLVEDGEDGQDGQSALVISSPQWEFIYPATNEGNLTSPIVPVSNQFTLFYGTKEKAVDKWYLPTRVAYIEDYAEDGSGNYIRADWPIYYVGTDQTLVNAFPNDPSFTGWYYLWLSRNGDKFYSDHLNLQESYETDGELVIDSVVSLNDNLAEPWNVGQAAETIPVNGLSITNTGLLYSAQNFGFSQDVVNIPVFAETTVDGETIIASEMVHFVKQKTGAQGERGFAGKIMRGVSNWSSSPDAPYQGLEDTNPYNIYYDVVTHNGVLYYCKVSEYNNSAAASYEPNVSSGWQNVWQVATNYKFVATDLLLANNAYIDFLGSRGIYLRDDMGQVVGGAQGGDGVIFWAGGNQSNITNANFRAYKSGRVVMNEAQIKGELQTVDNNGKGVTISNNILSATDSNGDVRLNIGGDPINIGTPAILYAPLHNIETYNFSASYPNTVNVSGLTDSFELYSGISISSGAELFVPALSLRIEHYDNGFGGSEVSSLYIRVKNSSNVTVKTISYSGSIPSTSGINTITTSAVSYNDLSAGTYKIVVDYEYEYDLEPENQYDPYAYVSLTISDNTIGNVSVVDSSARLVQIGSNGLSVNLGGSFSAVFAIDTSTNNQRIELLGPGGIGLRVTSSGVEVNNGSGWGRIVTQ